MKNNFVKIMGLLLLGVIMTMLATPAPAQNKPVSFSIKPHHVALSVPDAEATAAWYEKMLGFTVVMRMNEDAVNKMKVVHIKRGDAYIEIFEVEGAKPLPEYRRDPSIDFRVHGLKHFAFQVEDTAAAVKELRDKGAEIAMETRDTPGIAFAFIRDNAGNCFELIQYKTQK